VIYNILYNCVLWIFPILVLLKLVVQMSLLLARDMKDASVPIPDAQRQPASSVKAVEAV
jgi:cytochrome c-type biogenesis protein CcmH/NrfF